MIRGNWQIMDRSVPPSSAKVAIERDFVMKSESGMVVSCQSWMLRTDNSLKCRDENHRFAR